MLRGKRKEAGEDVLQEGSLVCVYEGFTMRKMVTLKRGEWLHTKNARWKHDTFIGRRYGDRVTETMKDRRGDWEGTCVLLRPTMELWTDCLPHRTQIIYMPDISYITMRLGLRSGKTVVEAGTGSGSLTHSLARAVAPAGRVMTFDFHEERSKSAAKEFAEHGLSHIITAGHRDVCTQHAEGASHADWGFGLPPGTADAVMLDVPSPWLACRAVKETLKSTGIFCNYSPCIEQVQKTCVALEELGFSHIQTVEVLRKEFTEHTVRYKKLESRDDRLRKRRRMEAAEGDAAAAAEGDAAGDAPEEAETAEAAPAAEEPVVDDVDDLVDDAAPPTRMSIPIPHMRGHTAYLTFAYKTPQSSAPALTATEDS